MHIKGALRALLVLVLLVPAAYAEDVPALQLTFGIYPTDKSTEMYKKFMPVLEAIQADMGKRLDREVDITLVLFRNYALGIEALAKGDVDFVRFGPASYISAKRKNKGVQLLAMEEKKGKKRFKGHIIVLDQSPFRKLTDLKGRKFAFGDKNSTIGRYLSQAALVEAGILSSDLGSYAFLGRHDKVAEAVLKGTFEAGAVKSSTFKKANKDGKLRVLHSFDNVTKPWVARADLPPKTAEVLRATLLELKHKDALAALKVTRFVETSDDEYAFCRSGMKTAARFDR